MRRASIQNKHRFLRSWSLARVLLIVLLVSLVLEPSLAAAEMESGTIVLPSETCRGLFIVPLTLGEGEGKTLKLILDTGASGTFVDPGAIRRVSGRTVGAGKVSFKGGRIGQHEIGPLSARLYSMKMLNRALGSEIDGILGFPTFKDVLLTFDYPAREIRVSSGRLPRPDGREIFRDSGHRRPFLKTDVGGRRVKVLLDTGSTGRFEINSDRLAWSVEPRPYGASVGYGGVVMKKGGRLEDAIQFGPLRFEAPVATAGHSESQAGWHVLHHFVLTFDQKKNRIRMIPNSAGPVQSPPWTGTGFAPRPGPDGLEIIKVFPGTSAETAGLRAGDLIVAVDGVPVYERGCRDPRGDPVGRRLILTYLRDGEQAEAEIAIVALIP